MKNHPFLRNILVVIFVLGGLFSILKIFGNPDAESQKNTSTTTKVSHAKDSRSIKIDRLVDVCIEKDDLGAALDAARLGASPEKVNQLILLCIETGNSAVASLASSIIGRELTKNEVDRAIEICIEKGYESNASYTAMEFEHRNLTADEIERLMKNKK